MLKKIMFVYFQIKEEKVRISMQTSNHFYLLQKNVKKKREKTIISVHKLKLETFYLKGENFYCKGKKKAKENMGCPATAEAWKDTFYPNTLQHQSLAAGGDWQSVDDALTCLYLWKEAKKPSMSSDEVEEAYTLYNRLRGLKRSRNSRPSQST